MFKFQVTRRSLEVIESEELVSGTIGDYEVEFEFDECWEGWTPHAVFTNTWSQITKEQFLESNRCIIPWETLESPGTLLIGIYGMQEDKIRPTVYAEKLCINEGVDHGDFSKEPTPDVYHQLMTHINHSVIEGASIDKDYNLLIHTRSGEIYNAGHLHSGKDGLTPSIGEDKNWWIGDTNTGVKALAIDGKNFTYGDMTEEEKLDLVSHVPPIDWTKVADDEADYIKSVLGIDEDIDSKVAALVDSAPEALDTLHELAKALGDDPNFATTVATQLGLKANSADLSDVAFSGSFKDIKDAPMEDLGKFYYVYDINTEEETSNTTSTKYTNYTDALNNTRKTGVYKIEIYDQEIENGEVVWNTCESSLLFVSGGIGFNQDEVVHQMIFNNYIDDESSGSIYLPRIRTYSNRTGEYQWSNWTSPWGEAGDWGFETSGNKVREINDGDESNTISYPSSAAVYKFVNKKIEELDLGLTEEQLNKINNAIQRIPEIYDAGLTVLWEYYADEEYDEDDVRCKFDEKLHYIEHFMSDGEFNDWVEFYDAETIARRILALDKKINPTPITTIPTTLTPNQQYNFGEVTELALAFPTVANDGDVIYATFITGETVTTLTIDTTNTCDIEFVPEENTGYEVFGKYNGSIWIVNYSEYTVSEG